MRTKYILSSTQFRILFLGFILCFVSNSSFGQIVSGDMENKDDDQKKKDKIEKVKVERDSLTGTTYYLTGLYNLGHSSFKDRSAYGAYDDWNNLAPGHSGGATFGLLMPLGGGLSLDLGFSYFGQKENFHFESETNDSTYTFSNTYMQIGVPIKLRYTYGSKLQVFGFVGMTPVNLLNVRFNESYTKANGTSIVSETQLVKEKLSIFNVMATAGFGVTYNLDWIGFTLYPEYRHYLINTYDPKLKPIDHKMFGLGVNLGMTLRF